MTPTETLNEVFKQITQEQLENLAWHVGEGTGICCGALAMSFVRCGSG